MTTMKEVIDLVNKARKALGLEETYGLPKGLPRRADYCPLARALHAYVWTQEVVFETELASEQVGRAWGTAWGYFTKEDGTKKPAVVLPDALARFVENFDAGLYPEYELES